MQVRRPIPPLDPHRRQLPGLHERLHRRTHVGRGHPEVVPQARQRGHPVRGRGPTHQLARRVLPGRGARGQHMRGEHPVGQVVDDLELGAPAGDREVADQEQVVEHPPGVRPVPPPVSPGARPAELSVELPGGRGPAVPDRGEQRLLQLRVGLQDAPLAALGPVVVHPVPHHRPQVDRHERLDVGPELHDPARPALSGPTQQLDVVGPHPGEQRHVVRALQDVDGVHLQHAGARQRARERAHGRDGVPRVPEPLGGQGDPARLRRGEDHAHRPAGLTGCRAASRARRTSQPPCGSAAGASPRCCGRGS